MYLIELMSRSSSARKAVFLHWPNGHESIDHTVSHQGSGFLMPGHNVLQDLHTKELFSSFVTLTPAIPFGLIKNKQGDL